MPSVKRVELGDRVECDVCSTLFTDDNGPSGGFLFGSYAYCPDCAKLREPIIHQRNEGHYIKARCPACKSFRRWVLDDLRKGDNSIAIYTW